MALKDIILWGMNRRLWNQHDLEHYSGVNQPTICFILNGKTTSPQQKTILAIAEALGLTEGQIRGLQPIPGYEQGNLSEDAAHYEGNLLPLPLTHKQKAILTLMDALTDDQQDELIRSAEERAGQNQKIINELARPRKKNRAD